MAITRRLEYVALEKGTPHTEVQGTYSVVNEEDGKYLQIDRYGWSRGKIPGNKS